MTHICTVCEQSEDEHPDTGFCCPGCLCHVPCICGHTKGEHTLPLGADGYGCRHSDYTEYADSFDLAYCLCKEFRPTGNQE